MKNTLKVIGLGILTVGSANAAITFSSAGATALKDSTGLANIPAGSLVLLIADTTSAGSSVSDGFLKNSTVGTAIVPTGATALTTDPGVLAANASITAGGYFGGDRILATWAAGTGGSVSMTASTSVDIAGFESKNFAIIWFAKTPANLTSLAGEYFGIGSGTDWVLPGANSGGYSFSPSSFSSAAAFASLQGTAAQYASTGFFTGTGIVGDVGTPGVKTAAFQLLPVPIPEPSAALLGAIGALGLLRRRRN